MKALDILKDQRDLDTNYDHRSPHKFDEAIEELEELEIFGKCLNCKKCDFSKSDKQTFHKGYCTDLLMPVHLCFGCNRFIQRTNNEMV